MTPHRKNTRIHTRLTVLAPFLAILNSVEKINGATPNRKTLGQIVLVVIVLFGILGASVETAQAQNRTWTNGLGGDWDDLGNWSPSDVPDTNTETAIINGTGTFSIDYDNAFTINGLTFSNPNATLTIHSMAGGLSLLKVDSDLSIAGTLNINSDFDARDASLIREGTITNDGTINFGGTSVHISTDRNLNADVINNGNMNVNQNASLNRAGGVFTNNGTVTIATGKTLNFGSSTGTFNQESGSSVVNDGTFDFSGDILNFNGGSFSGNAIQLLNSDLNIGAGSVGTGVFDFRGSGDYSGDLAAAQTINIHARSGGPSLMTATSDFDNNNVININSDFDARDATLIRVGTVTNSGTINFGGTSVHVSTDRNLSADVINNGNMNVNQTASLNRAGGVFTNNGTVTTASGKTLNFGAASGTFNQESGSTVANSGTFDFSGDILNFNGGSFSGNAIQLLNSDLHVGVGSVGAGEFDFRGNGDYSGDLAAAQTINLHARAGASSTMTTTLDFANNGVLNIISDFDARDATLTRDGTFTNNTTINFGGMSVHASTDRRISAEVINNGNVNVNQNASLTRAGGSFTNNSAVTIAAGKVLNFGSSAGTFNQESGSTVANSGTFDFSGDILNFNGGSFSGNAIQLLNSDLHVGVGSMGAGEFDFRGNGDYSGDLAAAQKINLHAQAGSPSTMTATGDFTNSGIINIISDFNARDSNLSRDGVVTNSGVINFDGSSTHSSTNRRFFATLDNSSTGIVDVIADSVGTEIGRVGSVHTNSGLVVSRNDTNVVTLLGTSFTNNADGTVAGLGEYDFTQTGFANNGNLDPGLSAGTLTLDGDIDFGLTALLSIELGGTIQGTEYDWLNAFDTLNLDGDLNLDFINSFENSILNTDVFTILTAGTLNGTFAGIADGATVFDSGGFGTFTLNYVGNSVVLGNFQATAVPEPGTTAIVVLAIGTALIRRRRKSAPSA